MNSKYKIRKSAAYLVAHSWDTIQEQYHESVKTEGRKDIVVILGHLAQRPFYDFLCYGNGKEETDKSVREFKTRQHEYVCTYATAGRAELNELFRKVSNHKALIGIAKPGMISVLVMIENAVFPAEIPEYGSLEDA